MSADNDIGKAVVSLIGCGLLASLVVIFIVATIWRVWA